MWLYSLTRGTSTRITFDEPTETAVVWDQDGQHIYYSSNLVDNLFRAATDGTGVIEQLTDTATYQYLFEQTAPLPFPRTVNGSLSSIKAMGCSKRYRSQAVYPLNCAMLAHTRQGGARSLGAQVVALYLQAARMTDSCRFRHPAARRSH